MTRRDNFSPKTIDKLAKRAGNCCSNPDCRRPSFGAAEDSDKFINIGVAAHITAAARGGPRYEPNLTPEQRRHYSNGLWLCQNDAKLIDANPEHYTVAMLGVWKNEAERRSFKALTITGEGVHSTSTALQEDLAPVLTSLLAAAGTDVEAFKHAANWPEHPIALKLRIFDGSARSFDVSGLAAAIQAFNEIAIVAPPGTGKTTTLVQTAEAINDRGESAAVFVPLGEWSSQPEPLLQSILRRAAFSGIPEDHLKLLADRGRLVLVLDGWNELDPESQKRLAVGIRQLQRDYPSLGIIISTRRQALDMPMAGRLVEIDTLSEDQQLEIARALRGADGASILDHAWRTPGVRELVTVPLYLTALLARIQGERLPTTKEEVLRFFVAEHEQPYEKATALRNALLGFHHEMLVALATSATNAANTSIAESQGRVDIALVSDALVAGGQMQSRLEPMTALEVLVSQHVLIRSGSAVRALSFQHQQFQEWYASFEVERLIQLAQSRDPVARKSLREAVLNAYQWEEPILFACERMSRRDDTGTKDIAATIVETLAIDPMLAAVMIQRSSDRVWDLVRGPVLDFVDRWHTDGTADRALRFIVDTGRADFAEKIWPVIANPDTQVHLEGLRASRRFRPSVLGPDAQARIAALPRELREHVVSELVYRGDMDGMELAVTLARADADPTMKIRVVEALLFRRADRLALQVLQTSPDAVWHHLARRGYADEISEPEAAARLHAERRQYLQQETDGLAKLSFLLNNRLDGAALGPEVQRLISAAEFPIRAQHAAWSINEAHERYPHEVVGALLHRLEYGLEIPHGMETLIRAAGVSLDDGPLVTLVLQRDTTNRVAEAAVSLVGPKTTGKLIDALHGLAVSLRDSDEGTNDAIRKQFHNLMDWILKTQVPAFLEAAVRRSDISEPGEIALLAELIGAHGGREAKGPLTFDPPLRETLCTILVRWAEILVSHPEATRKQMVEVARAIGRVTDPRLLPTLQCLLSEDLTRWRKAREFRALARGARPHPDVYMSWTNWYGQAFAAFDGEEVIEIMKSWLPDPLFGVEAATVLTRIWDRMNGGPAVPAGPFEAPFSKVRTRRIERQTIAENSATASSSFAEMIFAVVDELAQPGAEPAQQVHSIGLAVVAFGLRYGNQTTLIDRLLGLPQSREIKGKLLKALVQAGETIPAADVMEGFQSLLEDAKAKPWLLQDQQGWQLNVWLELFPFSDRPFSIMDALGMLEPRLKQPWQLHAMLSALSHAPAAVIEEILPALAQMDKRLVEDHHWNAALEQCGTESAARLILDLVVKQERGGGAGNAFSSARRFAQAMQNFPAFRAEVYTRYEQGPADVSLLLEHAVAEAADETAVLMLVRQHASWGRAFDHGSLGTALEHVALGQRPSPETAGARAVFSVPLVELRKTLFAMAGGGIQESALAAACLNAIDEIRDQYGVAESEPRHPDIATGRPWPSFQ